jgi:hypothetical protein
MLWGMTTLAEAQAKVTEYLAAESAILQGKDVRLGSAGMERRLVMEDLEQVRNGRIEWERRVSTMLAAVDGVPRLGGLTMKTAVFC